jgi:hypothetical protein
MKLVSGIVAAAAILLIPATAHAQEAERPYISGIYYQCQIAGQDRADAIVRNVVGPVYDRHMAAGHITAWGWLGHYSGGAWRRVNYFVVPTLDAVFDMQEAIRADLRKDHQKEMTELNTICPTHDDYIWRAAAVGAAEVSVQDRPAASNSTYYECNTGDEAEADALVSSALGPIFNKHMAAGHIRSWSWWTHVSGGKYRRLLVVDGASHKANTNGIGQIVQEMQETQREASRRFGEICSSHQDYMWDILTQPTPLVGSSR